MMAVVFLLVSGSARALSGSAPACELPWRGLSLAAAFLLLIIAGRVYLGRFELLFEHHTIFDGVTYTDAHVTLTGMLVVCVALAVGRADRLLAGGLFAPRGRWLVAAVAPAVSVMRGSAWRAGMSRAFVVKPNELVREQPYIAHNIEMTRQAYGLDRFVQREFPAETTVDATDPANNQATLQQHPPLGLARPAGYPAPDAGDSHLLRFSRHRHRSLSRSTARCAK